VKVALSACLIDLMKTFRNFILPVVDFNFSLMKCEISLLLTDLELNQVQTNRFRMRKEVLSVYCEAAYEG
jgi:hypothetical protein